MWEYLRSLRYSGARFRRETPIGPYIVDFAGLSASLVIQADGGSHDPSGGAERDRPKDAFLVSEGFRVIRIRDADAIGGSGAAHGLIENAVLPFLQTPPPAPPRKGGGARVEPGTTAEPSP